MIDKISKCVIVFAVGVTISLASMAFFESNVSDTTANDARFYANDEPTSIVRL